MWTFLYFHKMIKLFTTFCLRFGHFYISYRHLQMFLGGNGYVPNSGIWWHRLVIHFPSMQWLFKQCTVLQISTFYLHFPFYLWLNNKNKKRKEEKETPKQHFQIQTLPSILKLHSFAKKCAVAQMLSPDFFLKVRCAMTCLITTEICTTFFLLKIKATALHT